MLTTELLPIFIVSFPLQIATHYLFVPFTRNASHACCNILNAILSPKNGY